MGNINFDNLQRMRDHLDKVDPDKFTMGCFRQDRSTTHECNSVGCILGHCFILEENPEDYIIHITEGYETISYPDWLYFFTGIKTWSDEGVYLFGAQWTSEDTYFPGVNSLQHAKDRLDSFIEHKGDLRLCKDFNIAKKYLELGVE